MSELFNTAHSEVQIYQLISNIYKIVFNFKIALKSARDVVVSRLTTVSNSKLIFENFSNFIYQICFEILIYCDSTNRTILISIELAHFLFVSVLHIHFSQLLSVVSFSYSFSLSSTITFIGVTISSILHLQRFDIRSSFCLFL